MFINLCKLESYCKTAVCINCRVYVLCAHHNILLSYALEYSWSHLVREKKIAVFIFLILYFYWTCFWSLILIKIYVLSLVTCMGVVLIMNEPHQGIFLVLGKNKLLIFCVGQRGREEGEDGGMEPAPKLMKKVSDGLTSMDFSSNAKTQDGRAWNFKIASWNINGVRAWLNVSEAPLLP